MGVLDSWLTKEVASFYLCSKIMSTVRRVLLCLRDVFFFESAANYESSG